MRKGLESTNQTRAHKANKHKRGPKDNSNKHTKHDTTQIPTLSPPLASRRQKGREDTYTRGGSGREVIPLLLVLLVRLSGGDSLLDVIL